MAGKRTTFVNIGQRFGKLEVIKPGYRQNDRPAYLCRCDCGNETIVRTSSLRNGLTRSCGFPGCMGKHYMCGTSTYQAWADMLQRCSNPKIPSYHRYGGRGIKVQESWKDFLCFLSDMGEAPEGLELDRIDNDGHYTKDNCRWTTHKINCNNRS